MTSQRIEFIFPRMRSVVLAAAVSGSALCGGSLVYADHVNVTGQGQQTQGSGPTGPGNPAQGDKPLLPGDQPSKQGTAPSSQVHNIDQRDLEAKKHKDSENTP